MGLTQILEVTEDMASENQEIQDLILKNPNKIKLQGFKN